MSASGARNAPPAIFGVDPQRFEPESVDQRRQAVVDRIADHLRKH